MLTAAARIPRGRVATYGELAAAVGRPHAARAVGNVLHANPFSPAIPCHRVILSDGRLGGFANGARRKLALLVCEGVRLRGGRIDLHRYGFGRF